MGWCSGTGVFDAVASKFLAEPRKEKNAKIKFKTDLSDEVKIMIRTLIEALEDMDWDCQDESTYWDHPLVRSIMRDRHPHWAWDE